MRICPSLQGRAGCRIVLKNNKSVFFQKIDDTYPGEKQGRRYIGGLLPALLKDKHVIFDVKCTLDRNIIDARL